MLHFFRWIASVSFILLMLGLSGCAGERIYTVVDDKYPFLAEESLPPAAVESRRNAIRKYDQLIKSGERVIGFDFRQTDVETAARLVAENPNEIYDIFLESGMLCRPEFRQAVLDTHPAAVLFALDQVKFSAADLACLADFRELPLYLYLPPLLNDQALAFLPKSANLRLLQVGKSQITDRGLAGLAGMKHLRELHLWMSPITDQGAATINGFTELRSLNVGGTSFSNAGLAALCDLGQMRRLSLWGTQVTDAGLIHLARMPRLEKLWLNNTAVGDGGMVYVAKLKDLRELYLWGTGVTDVGVSKLKNLTHLEKLSLNETPITDQSLEYLAGLKQLRFLDVSGTIVSDAAKEKLKQTMPELTIRQQ